MRADKEKDKQFLSSLVVFLKMKSRIQLEFPVLINCSVNIEPRLHSIRVHCPNSQALIYYSKLRSIISQSSRMGLGSSHHYMNTGSGRYQHRSNNSFKEADSSLTPRDHPQPWPALVIKAGWTETLSRLRIDGHCSRPKCFRITPSGSNFIQQIRAYLPPELIAITDTVMTRSAMRTAVTTIDIKSTPPIIIDLCLACGLVVNTVPTPTCTSHPFKAGASKTSLNSDRIAIKNSADSRGLVYLCGCWRLSRVSWNVYSTLSKAIKASTTDYLDAETDSAHSGNHSPSSSHSHIHGSYGDRR
jgi:hypothetical protein